MNERSFQARLVKNDKGGTTFDVPFDVKEAFGKARAPVKVTLRGFTFPTTIIAMSGKSMIGVNSKYREAAGVEAGKKYRVEVVLDASTRTVTPPRDLVGALKKKRGAWARWQALSFTHQREHVEAIEEAKKPETRARRIHKAIEMVAVQPAKKAKRKPAKR